MPAQHDDGIAEAAPATDADQSGPDGSQPAPTTLAWQPKPSRWSRWSTTKRILVVTGASIACLAVLVGASLGVNASRTGASVHPAVAPNHLVRQGSTDAVAAFARIEHDEQPPLNLLQDLSVPRSATAVSWLNYDGDYGAYDRAVVFKIPASTTSIYDYYLYELPRHHWSVTSDAPPFGAKGEEVLATFPEPTYYWEVGVSIVSDGSPNLSLVRMEVQQIYGGG